MLQNTDDVEVAVASDKGIGVILEHSERQPADTKTWILMGLLAAACLFLMSRQLFKRPFIPSRSTPKGFAKSHSPQRYCLSKVVKSQCFTICGVPLGIRSEQLSEDCTVVQGPASGHCGEATLFVGSKPIFGIIVDPPTEVEELEAACSDASLEYNGILLAQPGTPINQVRQQLDLFKVPYSEAEHGITIKFVRECAVIYERKGLVTTFWIRQRTWPF